MKPEDIKRVAADALGQARSLVERWLPGGRLEGAEYKPVNPRRADSRPGSFCINLNTGEWADFAADARGRDLVGLYRYLFDSKNMSTAAEEVAKLTGTNVERYQPQQRRKFKALRRVPENAPEPDFRHWRHGTPALRWTYLDADGSPVFHVCRFNTPEGKEILPLAWTEGGWQWCALEDNRPLYGLQRLAMFPDRPILLVEGEKTADAAQRLFKNWNVVTWSSGSKAIAKTDWSPIRQRPDIVYWPDNDEPGAKSCATLAAIIPALRIVRLPAGLPDKWDLADPVPEGVQLPPPESARPYGDDIPQQSDAREARERERFFTPLGISPEGRCVYLSHWSGRIVELAHSSHSPLTLIGLAPLEYWERFTEPGKPVNWTRVIQQNVIGPCVLAGGFDPATQTRHQGVWDGRTYNDGNGNVWDIATVTRLGPIHREPRGNVYTSGAQHGEQPWPPDITGPLPAADALVREIAANLPIEAGRRRVQGAILLGWCASTWAAGSLPMRPFVVVNGRSGSGKSWVMENIVRRLGADLLQASGATEAGIRQPACNKAGMIWLDEAEADGRHIQSLMHLIRQVCVGDGIVRRGTKDGSGGRQFFLRPSFIMTGINPPAHQEADANRAVEIDFTADNDFERFARLRRAVDTLLTPELVRSFRVRCIRLVPAMVRSYRVFKSVLAERRVKGREADNVAAIMSGFAALLYDRPVAPEEAASLLDTYPVALTVEEREAELRERDTSDEQVLFHDLMTLKVEWSENGRPMSEMLSMLIQRAREGEGLSKSCAFALGAMGIKIDCEENLGWGVWIHRHNVRLARLVRRQSSDERYAGSLAKAIERAAWVAKNTSDSVIRLPGVQGVKRCVFVPVTD